MIFEICMYFLIELLKIEIKNNKNKFNFFYSKTQYSVWQPLLSKLYNCITKNMEEKLMY